MDLDHVYIDGTKIEANANKYSWVWKKSSLTSISREFEKITKVFRETNETVNGRIPEEIPQISEVTCDRCR